MAEFVAKRCEDMIPELEQMERLKLFDKNEIRGIAKKRKDHEYKIQRHTKNKEDYLRYIQYEMSILKLIKQRRDKFGIQHKKSEIEHAITNKVNKLYEQGIDRFKDDMRFWQAHMKFCKHVNFTQSMSAMIERMLKTHQGNPKCWHIAARWEIKENKNIENARRFLLRGMRFHPLSQLLFIDTIRLELDEADSIINAAKSTDSVVESNDTIVSESIPMKRAMLIYGHAKKINDVTFHIKILNIVQEHKNTEKLQKIIIENLMENYKNEPETWDIMARRELNGFVYKDNCCMNIADSSTMRDRISSCNEVYQNAVKKINTEIMWSLYIDCLLEINQDMVILPNYKKKLLKIALMQAHHVKKLQEQYYVDWIEMLKSDERDEKLYEILCNATEALPMSVNLWHEKLKYLIKSGQNDQANTDFDKAIKILGAKSLPLWRMRLIHVQAKYPDKVEEIFEASMLENEIIAIAIKPIYLDWLTMTKGIKIARQKYAELSVRPPTCLELHKKMAALELMQSPICKQSARRPYETATIQFGKTHVNLWIDYILFEMKHGDPNKVADIHRRAVKTLEAELSDTFSTQYSLIKANIELNETLE